MKALALSAALLLAGCVNHDRFGNEYIVRPTKFLYQRSETHHVADHAAVLAWCLPHRARMSNDGDACVWTSGYIINDTDPCIFVVSPMPADRFKSDMQFLRSVCNGELQ